MVRARVLDRIRSHVRARRFVLTLHADEEMRDDDLDVYDVMSALLHGRVILQQLDRHREERKYVVEGPARDERAACVVCKLSAADMLVVITVFRGGPEKGRREYDLRAVRRRGRRIAKADPELRVGAGTARHRERSGAHLSVLRWELSGGRHALCDRGGPPAEEQRARTAGACRALGVVRDHPARRPCSSPAGSQGRPRLRVRRPHRRVYARHVLPGRDARVSARPTEARFGPPGPRSAASWAGAAGSASPSASGSRGRVPAPAARARSRTTSRHWPEGP